MSVDAVANAFAAMPETVQPRMRDIRAMIFAAAEATRTGPLTETLKWGAPSYLTNATKSGTTIRLGQQRADGRAAMFVHCQTTLIDAFRDRFADQFEFDGNRALILPDDPDLDALAVCIACALTYHRDNRKPVP
jgi:hypothetical protein